MKKTYIGNESLQNRTSLRELLDYYELIYYLTLRSIKSKYQQSILGIGWVIIPPIITMVVFSVIFGVFAKIPSNGVPYPLFILSGLIPWLFFTSVLTNVSQSMVVNISLISKIYFPRLILPICATLVPLIDLILCFVVLVILMGYYGMKLIPEMVFIPFFILDIMLVGLAFGIWFAALNVKYRDIGHLVPLISQIGLYISPVIYSVSLIPPVFQGLYWINPMALPIEGIRWSLLRVENPPLISVLSLIINIIILFLGLVYFRKMEEILVDVI